MALSDGGQAVLTVLGVAGDSADSRLGPLGRGEGRGGRGRNGRGQQAVAVGVGRVQRRRLRCLAAPLDGGVGAEVGIAADAGTMARVALSGLNHGRAGHPRGEM